MKLDHVELTEEQIQKLEEIAKLERVTVSDIVSRAVDELLEERKRKRDELWKRSLEIVGKYHSGRSDISERHDDYLDEDYD